MPKSDRLLGTDMTRPVVIYHSHPGVGDLMWHLPFIRALAKSRGDASITLLTRRTTHAHSLLAAESSVARVEYVPYVSGPLRHVRELFITLATLRRLRPRALWILDKISRPAIAARLLGVRDVFGFGLGSQVRWVRGPTLPDDLRDAHQIDKLQAFFKQHDIPVPSQEPLLVLSSTQIDTQRDHFRAYPRPWVMLGVGARNQARRWPSESFCALIKWVDAVGTWFVLGGLDEFDAIERDIVARVASSTVVNISHAKMAEAAALVSACDLFIGNDSGPMNVAAAVGTNTIGLFGVTPALTHSNYIHPLSSSKKNRRMEGIAVEDVAGLASRLLAFDKPPCTSP